MNFNCAIIAGRVGKDPEVRNLESGSVVARFPVASTETWKDKEGEKKEATEWHNIVFWGHTAKTVEKYVQKGSLVLVEGKIATRQWEDKEGNTRYQTEIVGNKLQLGPKNQVQEVTQVVKKNTALVEEEDELPF